MLILEDIHNTKERLFNRVISEIMKGELYTERRMMLPR